MEITAVFWLWIAVAAVFALIELFTVTFFGLWMALAALIPALAVLLHPGLAAMVQIILWLVASLLCAWIWVRWVRSPPEPFLSEPLIGQQGLLASALEPGGSAILLLMKPVQGRQEWPCTSDQSLARQTRVKVVAMAGKAQVKVEAV